MIDLAKKYLHVSIYCFSFNILSCKLFHQNMAYLDTYLILKVMLNQFRSSYNY